MKAPNAVLKLRQWQTLDDAALLLSRMTDEPVTRAQILGLGLEGHLKLAVFLPEGTIATCWNLEQDTLPRDVEDSDSDLEDGISENDVPDPHDPTGLGVIDDVWDLPMVPPASLQVRNWFNELSGLPLSKLARRSGAVVERPGTHCRLRAEGEKYSSPASVLPAGSQIVVRTPEIVRFVSTLSESDPLGKPFSDSERTTLLVIIGALAKIGPVDLSQPYAAGKTVAEVTQKMGAAVSEKTIGNHLKLVLKAIEERMK